MVGRDKTFIAALVLIVGGVVGAMGMADPPGPAGPPGQVRPGATKTQASPAQAELAAPVKQLIAEPYLKEEERRELRLKHGVWEPGDLDTPAHRALAALTRGDYLDPALSDESVDPLLRAEAMLRRGELEEVLRLAEGNEAHAVRLRVDALWELGRYTEARAEIGKALKGAGASGNDAEAIVNTARAGAVLIRVRDPKDPKATDNAAGFKALMAMLARARDEADRFSWSARLAEARLLDEKDNLPEAAAALQQALTFNPRAAETWALAGQFAVESFNLDGAEVIAAKLDALAAGVESDGPAAGAEAEPGAEASPQAPKQPGGQAEPDGAVKAAGKAVAPSFHGAIVRANARLRASDAIGAEDALKLVLERYPKSRDLLALHAAIVAAQFDMVQADHLLGEYDAISPGSAEAYLQVGRVLSSERQYADAAKYLEEAAKRAPSWSDPVTELGLLEVQAGRDDRALNALEKAVALDPFNTRAGNSLTLVRELRTFSHLDSEHFIVRYKPGVDQVLAEEMPAYLEEMYQRVTGDAAGGINYEPPGKTVIELMPDHHWFSVRITGMPRVHTIAASTGPVVAMEAPKEGPGHLVGPYDWLRVVRHEFTHTVTLARTKNRLPHWFTEAAAVYLEDSPRDYSTCQLLARAIETDTLFNLDDINTAFVRPRKQTDRSQAYAQGHLMYEYIVTRWGPKAPLDLMDRYAAGEREAGAMRTVLGVSRDEFLGQFKTWAEQKLVEWGMNPPAGEPTVRELVAEARQAARKAEKDAADAAKPDAPSPDGPDSKVANEDAPKGESVGGRAEKDIPNKELAERWVSEHPDNPQVLSLAVAFELQRTGGKADAGMIPLLERYAKARPVDDTSHKVLARYFLEQEAQGMAVAPEAVIPHLEFLDAREQHSASYAMELAKRYAAIGDWTKAWAKAQRATRVDPFNPATRELAASVALKRNDPAAAEHQILALTVLEPDREIHKKRLEAVRAKMGS